jgi:hopene-associated glycosyltransferase HpnB
VSLQIAVTAVSLAAWLYLLLARGNFWRDGPYLSGAARTAWPGVVAIVPARNEAETIGRAVASLAAQAYDGALSIVVVDDQSTDGTAALARSAGSTRPPHVLSGTPLPAGWTGKMWAVAQGVDEARRIAPDAGYLWLTDADIEHGPTVLSTLVAKAEREHLGLVSQMVLLRCESRWERFLVPAFVFFFKKLYPFAWSNTPGRRTAAAAGGCMLVRTDALGAAGGIAAIRGEIIDDCALAAAIKPHRPIWLGLTQESRSLRRYERLADVWDMVARTAFVQLRQSWLLLAGTIVGMAILYAAPPTGAIVGLIDGSAPLLALGVCAWTLMALAYLPTLRLYRRPPIEALLLPVAALLYTVMTIASAWRSLSGSGARWKDRSYSKGMERASSHE